MFSNKIDLAFLFQGCSTIFCYVTGYKKLMNEVHGLAISIYMNNNKMVKSFIARVMWKCIENFYRLRKIHKVIASIPDYA